LAKRRFGEAARSVDDQTLARRAWAPRARRSPGPDGGPTASSHSKSNDGFTLIELVIVIGVMPMVIGALAVGILSVFSLQNSVSNRLGDSGDAQLVSANFQDDVQSASLITTAASPASAPASCGTGTQVLGLQLGNGSQISYTVAQASSGKTYDLWRNVCNAGSAPVSSVLSYDIPSSQVPSSSTFNPLTPLVSVTCSSSATACAVVPLTGGLAYTLDWVSTVGITGVKFNTTEPGSQFDYTLVATPLSASSSSQLPQPANPSTGCQFSTLGTGTYAQSLCFVDFSPWNPTPNQTPATSLGSGYCDPAQNASFSTPFPMTAAVTGSPFTLDLCMSVSANLSGTPITGTTSAAASCGVAARTGYDDITASPLPTYACPPSSEAFLGNNGFYTGVPGAPALYEVDDGSDATINFTNIALVNANGSAISNWRLVTGDAESTDPGESISWSTGNTNVPLKLLPNTATSDVGNACDSTPPGYSSTGLSGVGSDTVVCTTSSSTDKTGTPMLTALYPSSLTVTLDGGGLEAMFLGVLLQQS
jgi:type II secretory pathway pseudopilin PulG